MYLAYPLFLTFIITTLTTICNDCETLVRSLSMTDENEIKKIKKERRELFAILGDTFTEHIPLDVDHEIGTDSDCELCVRHNLINDVLKKQETILEDESNKKFGSKNKKVHYMTVEEPSSDCYLIGSNLQKAVREAYPTSKIKVIKPQDYPDIFIETKKDVYVSLETIHSEGRVGIIAKQGTSGYATDCQRRLTDKFIRYTGDNFEDIIKFCHPFVAHKTKKGKKVAVTTHRGNFSVSVGEVIVKNPFGNLELYSFEEFDYLFDIKGDVVWRNQ